MDQQILFVSFLTPFVPILREEHLFSNECVIYLSSKFEILFTFTKSKKYFFPSKAS